MITRNWKIVKGTAERRKGLLPSTSTSCGKAYYQKVQNVKDTSGQPIDSIVVGCDGGYVNSSSNTGEGIYCSHVLRAISLSNETLFVYLAKNLDPEVTQFWGGTSMTDGGGSFAVFGSDATPPTSEDYNLKSPIKSGITCIEQQITTNYNEETNNFEYLIAYYGKVTEDMTIRETGVCKTLIIGEEMCNNVNNAYYKSSDFYKTVSLSNILCTRDVLETPLDLKAGDGFRVTIKVEM